MYPPGFPQPTTGSVDGTALTRGWELIVKKPWWFASISAGSSRFVSGDIKSSHQGVRSTCTSRAGDCRNSTQLQCVILTVVGCNLPNISSFMTKTYKAADPWLLHAVYEHVYAHSTWAKHPTQFFPFIWWRLQNTDKGRFTNQMPFLAQCIWDLHNVKCKLALW